jgi:DNA-binding ferritin-like protein
MKTKVNKKAKMSKTRKNVSPTNQYTQQKIVTMFLQMLNTVKLYHWKTHSYAQHKATDQLYDELNDNIDTFVETMLGKKGDRVNLTGQKTIPLLDYTDVTNFKKEVEKYKTFLIDMNKDAGLNITNNSDLLNIRDELLGNLNQFTYLLTLK